MYLREKTKRKREKENKDRNKKRRERERENERNKQTTIETYDFYDRKVLERMTQLCIFRLLRITKPIHLLKGQSISSLMS